MGLFKSQREKDMEKKLLLKKTINTMQKQIDELERQKQVFIEKARKAKTQGLESQYNLALTGYKMTLTQQKRAQEMLLNFEITSQMKDMSNMTKEFLGGMSVLSNEMAKLTNEKEFLRVQEQFEIAMGKVEVQTEQMEVFMENSSDSFKQASGQFDSADNKNIEDVVLGTVSAGENDQFSNESIEKEMEILRKKIDSGA